jgi:hypothetical protein
LGVCELGASFLINAQYELLLFYNGREKNK